LGAMIALVWAVGGAAGIGAMRLFRRSLLALPFILIALPSLFAKPGVTLFEWDLGIMTLTATDGGADFVGAVMLKSWASVSAAALLTATTPYPGLMHGLRALRVPAVIVSILAFMYRYIFVIVDETARLLRARSARSALPPSGAGGGKPGGTLTWRAKTAGSMAGSLFIRTYDRSERVYMAMLARGFDGEPRLPATRHASGTATATCAAMAAACVAVAVSARFTV
ncbi:MAG: cobalt ECF transporter T component CbiQ, partial [Chloroflexota bacterium]